jgi:hypothetical protein
MDVSHGSTIRLRNDALLQPVQQLCSNPTWTEPNIADILTSSIGENQRI